LRVITLVLEPFFQEPATHTGQGLATIVLGVLMLAALDVCLGRVQGARERAERATGGGPRRAFPLGRLIAAASVLGALAAGTLWIGPWQVHQTAFVPLSRIPVQFEGGWSASGLKLNKRFLGSLEFSESTYRRYRRGREVVDLLLGADRRLSGRTGVLSPKTAVLGPGWEIIERSGAELGESGREVESFLERFGRDEQLVYRWHYGVGSTLTETVRAVLAMDRSPLRRPARAVVVRLSTPMEPGADDRAAAEARLRDFAAIVERALLEILETP
jgi:hypothetical protein